MDYQYYTVEDFVQDKYFRKWLLDPDKETQQFWETWVAEHPKHAHKITQAQTLVLLLPEVRHVFQKEQEKQLWNKIVQEIHSPTPVRNSGRMTPLHETSIQSIKRKRSYISTFSVAASLLILVSFFTAYFFIYRGHDFASEPANWVIKENPYGQRSTIYLSDGTEVVLNAGSRLRYREQFSKDRRRVMLQGEAYFRVTKDTRRPFEVVANHITTQALGTSFNISAFKGEPLQVSLITGKVLVKQTQKEDKVFLLPGQCAIYDTLSLTLKKETFDEKMVLAWKNGIIYFRNADEQTVFEALEKWYGVKITPLNPSPKAWSYTGQLERMSLDQFLEALQFSMDFQYQIKDKQVTIEYYEKEP